jgi:hypothetical protein
MRTFVPKNINNMTTKEERLKELAELIRKQLKKQRSYSMRPVTIDGVLCYPVIHKHKKIVNFECINIECNIGKKDNDQFERYSLLHMKYKSIESAIEKIEKVVGTYKIYNGDLLSPTDFKMVKLEETFIPYTDKQTCCVCYENTLDTTVCDHYICMHCRETCVTKKQTDCPMCRRKNIVHIYNIDNGLINNIVFETIKKVNDYENSSRRAFEEEEEEDSISNDNERINFVFGRNVTLRHNLSEIDNDELSEIETLTETSENTLDESWDLIPWNLNTLFDEVANFAETNH